MELAQELFGTTFRNPVLLAAGTCGFGQEVAEVTELETLGGLVTKSVTREPRAGNPGPRVAELSTGMLNSIGLANPGLEVVRREKLPWIRDHLGFLHVFVSVAGSTPGEYVDVVAGLDGEEGFLGFELNLSCPNDTRLGHRPFALDPGAVAEVVRAVRRATRRPLLVKLAPNDPDLAGTARVAEEEGADGLTLVNTLPGLAFDLETRRPVLGAGPGGVSGPAIRAVGIHAVWTVSHSVSLPLVGVGGITSGEDAVQYLLAGASLVQVGTASFWDPRAAPRIVEELAAWGRRHGVAHVSELVGAGAARAGEEDAHV